MNSSRKTRQRRERLQRELAELEARSVSDLEQAKHKAVDSLKPSAWIARHPGQAIAWTVAAGAVIALAAGRFRRSRGRASGPASFGTTSGGDFGDIAQAPSSGKSGSGGRDGGIARLAWNELRRILMRKGIQAAGALIEERLHAFVTKPASADDGLSAVRVGRLREPQCGGQRRSGKKAPPAKR
jgi:hypothetical protein